MIICSKLTIKTERRHLRRSDVFIVKACVRYFYQFFIFFIKFKNYEKCFLFHIKSSFRSRDIQIFVFFPFPHFPDAKG